MQNVHIKIVFRKNNQNFIRLGFVSHVDEEIRKRLPEVGNGAFNAERLVQDHFVGRGTNIQLNVERSRDLAV